MKRTRARLGRPATHSMNARKCVHAQIGPTPVEHSRMSQARSEEEEIERPEC